MGVLVHEHGITVLARDHLQQGVGAVLGGEDLLLDAGLEAPLVTGTIHIWMNRIGSVSLAFCSRVPGPSPERHALHRARGQRSGRAADVVLVSERALDHVGEPFDVTVGMHRPDRARNEPVVVEHTQGAEPHVLGSWYESKE